MCKVQGCGQGSRVWERYKVGGNLSTCFFCIHSVGYTLSGKETGRGQSTRMWAKYKDMGKVQGCGQSTRI